MYVCIRITRITYMHILYVHILIYVHTYLHQVASYDHWEPCQWDEFVNEDMMARNPDDLSDMVRRSGMTYTYSTYAHTYVDLPGMFRRSGMTVYIYIYIYAHMYM